jgi:LuxR family transcriptional regulator, activator of tox operons
MRVIEVSAADQAICLPIRRHVARLFEQVGTGAFEGSLFFSARETTNSMHISAFVGAANEAPRTILAEDDSDDRASRRCADFWTAKFWRQDPVSHYIDQGATLQDGRQYGFHCEAEDIPSDEYRSACYTGVGVMERISIIEMKAEEVYRMNFYRSRDIGGFSPQDVDAIFAGADVWMALIHRHAIGRDSKCTEKAFVQRLKALHSDMPQRELEVCVGIAKGISSEGIGLQLGISVNTVLTYRKRAYARLKISSQNELLRLSA